MIRPVAAALWAAAAAAGASGRVAVPINFGWRFAPDANGPAHGGDAHGPAVNSTAPAADAPQGQPGFDDSGWAVIDIPHDASVTGDYASTENGGEGFLPLARTWYRKQFTPPAAWEGQTVTLVVDGALSTTTWYLNGKQILVQNPVGYLPTILQLQVTLGKPNLLACYVDGGLTTGWWYEGSGLIRSARLVATSADAAVAPFGISSPSFVTGVITPNGPKTSDGLTASAVLTATATLLGAKASSALLAFTLFDRDGNPVATSGTGSNAGAVMAAGKALPSAICPPSAFNFSANGLDCDGLSKNAAGRAAANDCKAACCAVSDCDVWQWASGSDGGCWMGHASCSPGPVSSHAQWVGGARTAPHGSGHPCGKPGGDPCPHGDEPVVMALKNAQLWSVARPYMCKRTCEHHSLR